VFAEPALPAFLTQQKNAGEQDGVETHCSTVVHGRHALRTTFRIVFSSR
jgi:hypothetical protein